MAKPKKPFMIERGDDLLKVTKSGKLKWVIWDGSQYKTKEEAQEVLDRFALTGCTIIEILDSISTRISFK